MYLCSLNEAAQKRKQDGKEQRERENDAAEEEAE